jgi:membrane protein YqaA with SNARE-associated domain
MHKEHKKRIAHVFSIAFIILIILFSAYSVINYRLLKNQVTTSIENKGYLGLFISSFILESFPSLIGPGTPLLAALLIKLNFVRLLIILLISTTISSLLTYYLGYRYSDYFKELIDKKNLKKYERLFRKYGKVGMIIAAVTAVPYIPILAGIFKMKPSYFVFIVTTIRIVNYIFTSYVLYLGLNYNWFGLLG